MLFKKLMEKQFIQFEETMLFTNQEAKNMGQRKIGECHEVQCATNNLYIIIYC